jgi:methionine sulfoxide reductase heme-binding subunit
MHKTSLLRGWPLVGVLAFAILANSAAIALSDEHVEAVRRVIRVTARSSIVLFLLAFTAAAVWRFWPNAWTRWQRQNRRYLGVSFAISHFVHLAAILELQRIAPDVVGANAITWIGGGLAYVFIAAMTITSFDRTTKMIGPRAWKVLHTTGSYYIWLIFASTYLGRAGKMPAYIPVAALVVGAIGLRIAARIARSREQQGLALTS